MCLHGQVLEEVRAQLEGDKAVLEEQLHLTKLEATALQEKCAALEVSSPPRHQPAHSPTVQGEVKFCRSQLDQKDSLVAAIEQSSSVRTKQLQAQVFSSLSLSPFPPPSLSLSLSLSLSYSLSQSYLHSTVEKGSGTGGINRPSPTEVSIYYLVVCYICAPSSPVHVSSISHSRVRGECEERRREAETACAEVLSLNSQLTHSQASVRVTTS